MCQSLLSQGHMITHWDLSEIGCDLRGGERVTWGDQRYFFAAPVTKNHEKSRKITKSGMRITKNHKKSQKITKNHKIRNANHKKSQKITKNHKIRNANHKKSRKITKSGMRITKNHKKSQKITKNTANMVIWPECLQGVDPTLGRRQTPWQCAGQGQMG